MTRSPYIRDLEGTRQLMVPINEGYISAEMAIKLRLSVNGKIYRSVSEIQQDLILLNLGDLDNANLHSPT